MVLFQIQVTDLLAGELRSKQSPRMRPELTVRCKLEELLASGQINTFPSAEDSAYNASSQQREKRMSASGAKLEILEFSGKHCLDILGIAREDILAAHLADAKGGDQALPAG